MYYYLALALAVAVRVMRQALDVIAMGSHGLFSVQDVICNWSSAATVLRCFIETQGLPRHGRYPRLEIKQNQIKQLSIRDERNAVAVTRSAVPLLSMTALSLLLLAILS